MSNEFMLDPQDKDLFIMYCRQKAKTARGMVDVMTKNNMPPALLQKEKAHAMAYAVVADDLESIESFSIGG